MAKTKPQGQLQGSLLGRLAATPAGAIASNWVFQGMRYMNAYEVALKLVLDVLLAAMLLVLLFAAATPVAIVVAFILAHTLNWIFNGHFFVLMRYVSPVPKTEQQFEDYVDDLRTDVARKSYIHGVAIYGSYCRGTLHKFSDLDVRVMAEPGSLSAVLASVYCFRLRFLAFFKTFPLDIYSCNDIEFLRRLRDDEVPVILLDRHSVLADLYAGKSSNG